MKQKHNAWITCYLGRKIDRYDFTLLFYLIAGCLVYYLPLRHSYFGVCVLDTNRNLQEYKV